jgi:integrase/recombinase XerD
LESHKTDFQRDKIPVLDRQSRQGFVMEKAVGRYLRWHKAMGHSARTIRFVDTTLDLCRRWLAANGHSTQIDEFDVEAARDWVADMQERGLSPATVASRVRALKAFTHWLTEEEYLDRDPLRKLRVPKTGDIPKPTLAPQDVDALLNTCDNKTITGARDYALMLMLYSTGIRASEICGLSLSDIDWDKGLVAIRKGKGAKYRVVPLGQKVERAIERYLAHKGRPDAKEDGPLFLTDEGEPLAYTGLKEMLRRRGNKAGIRANAHKFRHSAAVTYLRNGGRLETLRLMLGHSDYSTTLHYARLAGSDVAEAHSTADPAKALKHR